MTAITTTNKQATKTRALKTSGSHSKVSLPVTDGLRFERLDDIRYLEAAGNYTFLYFTNGERLLVCRTLQEMEDRLASPYRFLRIHRSYVINVDFLERYVRGKGGYVILEGNINLTVSASKRQDFLARLERYFR
jgi:two-component system LytT family response regulator